MGFVLVDRATLRKDRIVAFSSSTKTAKGKSQHGFKPAFWLRVCAGLPPGSIQTVSLSCLIFIAI